MVWGFRTLLAILLVVGCRRVDPGDRAEGEARPEGRITTWYPEDRNRSRGERPDLGPIDRSVLVKQVGEGPPESYNIRIEPEDTLDLFVQWTGKPVEVLLQWNPEVRGKGLVPGEWFRVVLTPGEFDRFNGTRKAYLAESRTLRDLGLEVREVVSHTVQEGETLKGLLDRYPTSLDLMEKLNPKLRLTGIRPGQVLRIPLVGAAQSETPALPGPKPPAPPPVPVPPGPPKPQTVQPAPPTERPAPPDKAVATSHEAPRPASLAPGTVEYVVQPGDTAWGVARHRFGVELQDLAEANPGVDLDRLRPGMKLVIPKKR